MTMPEQAGTHVEYRVWLSSGHHYPTTDIDAYLKWANVLGFEVVDIESRRVSDWQPFTPARVAPDGREARS